MKRYSLVVVVVALLAALLMTSGCNYKKSSSDIMREKQEQQLAEGVKVVGLPAIKNWRELRLAKMIMEKRDQEGLVTYTYTFSEMTGKLRFFGVTVGYPIPYSTQISAPSSMQGYVAKEPSADGGANGTGFYNHPGVEQLPQAEPNGLFSPSSAEGSWVFMKNPNGNDVLPVYLEPRVICSPFPLACEN